MKGPVEPVHRSVPETIQEVIELTGFLCFLFRSTPSLKPAQVSLNFLKFIHKQELNQHVAGRF